MKLFSKAAVLLALVILSLSVQANAQKIKTTSGDLAFLKNETSINVEFTYDNMTVGKYGPEKQFLKIKTEEYNQKEPGRGDNWAKSWVDRQG